MDDTDDTSTAVVPDHPTVLAALRLGSRAPSVHNTQPWRWVFDGSRLYLFGDPSRQLSSADPQGRQLVISCGAMLDHVRTAFAAQGWHTDTTRLPEPGRDDYLAVIDFRPWQNPPAQVRARVQAIDRRRTDRLPMLPPHHWEETTRAARDAAARHDTELGVLDEGVRPRLVAASEQSVALRRYDMQYQNELRWWSGHHSPADGVPVSALASEAELSQVGVGRAFPPAPRSLRRGDLDDHSRLLVLSSSGDTPQQWLHTGETLSTILLDCTAAGLATCPLTHITELMSSRRIISGLTTRPGQPQVLIRVGTAPEEPEQPPTPRRAVSEFLELRAAPA
ncbi:Acg family FMN-binding oxidoreductase [Nocardia donostiensis]|uniref:NAD(P)H nitroreductase n=1 Tax=Nocardia donostiensis TaxID=1538463 RepID=A0A1W0B018_9NOCA|nr:hypothetical protein [Nocardia donostiensis]ONM50206.1 hypothetical protein B0T46_03780 [Nocardia donostiensis]OQS15867.1 hypothetical protein B0T36_07875 [Nocardia donostiensis]OQS23674.1 hypothetical protein B0T44_02315 [Nocardia donostiensis]